MTLHAFVLLASIQISIRRRLSRARLYFFHSCDDEKRSHDQHGLAVLKLVFYSIRKCLLSKGPKSVAESLVGVQKPRPNVGSGDQRRTNARSCVCATGKEPAAGTMHGFA